MDPTKELKDHMVFVSTMLNPPFNISLLKGSILIRYWIGGIMYFDDI